MSCRAVIAIAAVMFAAAVPTAAVAQDLPRVAVIPFENPTTWWGWELGNTAAGQLTIELVNTSNFTVIERSRLAAIFDELHLGKTGAVDQATAAKIGKLSGAEYLITGTVTSFNIETSGLRIGGVGKSTTKSQSAMNVRVFNVTSGEIATAAKADGEVELAKGYKAGDLVDYSKVTQNTAWNPTIAEKALGPVIVKLAAALSAQKDKIKAGKTIATAQLMSHPPAIAGIAADGSVYIDQGENTGVVVGRRFSVMRIVDVIKDKDGNILDQVTKPSGTIEVIRVMSKSAVCKVIEGKPGAKDVLQPVTQ